MQDFILYHDAGSGGEFLTSLLLSTGDFYGNCNYLPVDDKGKVTSKPTKPEVQALFPYPIDHTGLNRWGRRKWDDWDEAKIKSLTDKTWILNSMRWKNIKTLREKGCDWPILRISYEKNMYWFIKKCVLKKVFRHPFVDNLDEPLDDYMLRKGSIQPWMLKKHLKWPKKITLLMRGAKAKVWKKIPTKWDIPVDNILAKDFSPLQDFDPSRFDKKSIDRWVNAQEPMFTKRPMLPKEIEKLFGYNKCLTPVDYACPLDEFDNIVIKFYYPDAPMFNNTQELFTYF
jgi:hypothetical protein